MSLGEVIKRKRTELGMSQAQLGEKVGRTGSTVRRWERGETTPGSDVIQNLASALHVDPGELAAEATAPPRRDATDPGAMRPAPPVPRSTQQPATPPARSGQRPESPPRAAPPPQPPPTKPPAPTPAQPAPVAAAPTPTAAPATAVEERPTEMAPIPVAPAAVAEPVPPHTPRFAFWRRRAEAPGTSYLEDTRQRWRYWMRYALTAVALLIGFVVLVWTVGELTDALGRVWDLFGEAESPDTTSLGTNF